MKYKTDTKTKIEEWIEEHKNEIIIFDAYIKSIDDCLIVMIMYVEKDKTN